MGNYFNYSGRGERAELQKSEKQKRGDRDPQGSPSDTEGRGGKEFRNSYRGASFDLRVHTFKMEGIEGLEAKILKVSDSCGACQLFPGCSETQRAGVGSSSSRDDEIKGLLL